MPTGTTNTDSHVRGLSPYADICTKLNKRAIEAGLHVELTKGNISKKVELEVHMNKCRNVLQKLEKAISAYAALVEAISDYIADKKRDSNTAVMAAMRAAAYIVPACDATLVPMCEDGEAWFQTEDEIDMSRLEGSGARSVLSILMRAVVLRANPQLLQTLVLDELFAKLSVENSATLSTYLPIIAQDMQVLSIEQKPEVFNNTSHVAYKFFLDGNHSVVQREDIAYD